MGMQNGNGRGAPNGRDRLEWLQVKLQPRSERREFRRRILHRAIHADPGTYHDRLSLDPVVGDVFVHSDRILAATTAELVNDGLVRRKKEGKRVLLFSIQEPLSSDGSTGHEAEEILRRLEQVDGMKELVHLGRIFQQNRGLVLDAFKRRCKKGENPLKPMENFAAAWWFLWENEVSHMATLGIELSQFSVVKKAETTSDVRQRIRLNERWLRALWQADPSTVEAAVQARLGLETPPVEPPGMWHLGPLVAMLRPDSPRAPAMSRIPQH